MSDSQTKKTPGKKPAGNAKAPGKPAAAPPAPSEKEGGKSKRLDAVKKKMSKAFDTFQNFWTPIFALLVISAIGFFISGIPDKDIISYSILIVVAVLILFNCSNILLISSLLRLIFLSDSIILSSKPSKS